MNKIDKFDLLSKVSKQEKTEKVPYALWKHFPEADKTAEGLSQAQLDFQQKYDSLFMKISPQGNYCIANWGAILGGYKPVSGARICERVPILSLDDWETLEPVDPNEGEFGVQIKAIELITRKTENIVPTVMTVFSPFMVASRLDPSVFEHMNQDHKLLSDQIKMLTGVMNEFAQTSLDAGANGLFVATQNFNESLSSSDLEEFEYNPMKDILLRSQQKSMFNILHLHGNNPYFHKASELPAVHAINWHDQTSRPSLVEGRQDFTGALVGGLDEMGILRTGKVEEIESTIQQVYQNFNGRGLIFGPGCVLPMDVPEEHIQRVVITISSLLPI